MYWKSCPYTARVLHVLKSVACMECCMYGVLHVLKSVACIEECCIMMYCQSAAHCKSAARNAGI